MVIPKEQIGEIVQGIDNIENFIDVMLSCPVISAQQNK